MIYRTLLSASLLATFTCGLLSARATAQDEPDTAAVSADAKTAAADQPKPVGPRYLLRYKFQPGETIRWKVEHRAQVRSTVSGTTQTAETTSNSIKVWKVSSVKEKDHTEKDGQVKKALLATFVHSVESVDMRQVLSGRAEVRYNSQTDAVPTPGYEEVAKDVGVPLCEVTINQFGNTVERKQLKTQTQGKVGEITLPLPENEIGAGETWSFPETVEVKQKDGSHKPVKVRKQFTLSEVKNGIATINVETVVLTPIRDPALEAQLIQHVIDGSIRFDVKAGRVISQRTDIDKHVVGFQGEASSLNYVTRFTEELLPPQASTAARAAVGPAPPPSSVKAAPPAPAKPAGQASAAAPAGGSGAPKSAAANTKTAQATKPSTKVVDPSPRATTTPVPAKDKEAKTGAASPSSSSQPKNAPAKDQRRDASKPATSTTKKPPASGKPPIVDKVIPPKAPRSTSKTTPSSAPPKPLPPAEQSDAPTAAPKPDAAPPESGGGPSLGESAP